MNKIVISVKNLMRKLGKWFWVILVVALIIVWRVITVSNTTIKVQTTKVTSGDLVQTVSTSGTVMADQYSQLTFPSGGKVAAVLVKSGDKVKKGAWIAQLDTIPLNAAYQEAVSNYRGYQAIADQVLDSVKGNDTTETFTQKATRTTAEVNRDNAYNAMLAAQDNLANAVITAPFAGVVDTVSPSSPGMQVLPGAADYTIVNPSTVYFDAEVEETDLPNITVGQQVSIKLDAYPNESYQGLVQSIGMVAFTSSTGGNAYHVRANLPANTGQKFKVGMGGDVDIVYNTVAQALKVPASAVTTDSTDFVWVIESGKAKKVTVDLGATNADEDEIKSGLTDGQVVISQPPATLKEGDRVQI